MADQPSSSQSPYWLVPFQNYKTFCPYLVGSYQTTAKELSRYIALGYRTFILDIPPDERELEHIGVVFNLCRDSAPARPFNAARQEAAS
jgi:alkanesulfonate monooxygenase